MPVTTRNQEMAQVAYQRIASRNNGTPTKEYATFAKKFPALIHTCGLAQAVAFAEAKKEHTYLGDLVAVLRAAGYSNLSENNRGAGSLGNQSRSAELSAYLRLNRDALLAAGWLKRYVEAMEN